MRDVGYKHEPFSLGSIVGLWGSNVQFFPTEGKCKKFGVDSANYKTTKTLKMDTFNLNREVTLFSLQVLRSYHTSSSPSENSVLLEKIFWEEECGVVQEKLGFDIRTNLLTG